MCGRYALGVNAAQLREGVAHHFPRLLNNSNANDEDDNPRDNRAAPRDPDHSGRVRRGGRGVRRVRNRGGRQPRAGTGAESGANDDDDDDDDDREDGTESRDSSPGIVAPRPRLRGGGSGGVNPSSIPWTGEERFREGNYNVAPRSNGVVIRLRERERGGEGVGDGEEAMRIRGGGDGGEEVKLQKGGEIDIGNQELVIETMQWGLIPHWSKHPPTGPLNTINARSENLIDHGAGGMWQSLKGPKRCLVVVQGYYEWQKKGTTKVPHFTCFPSPSSPTEPTPSTSTSTSIQPPTLSPPPLMFLAGLYDTVQYISTSDDEPPPPPHSTFTILTTTPSKSLEFLHDRMPCVLSSEEEGLEWLDCREGWAERKAKLLRPFEGKIECYPVQSEVGKVGTNSSSYILPVAQRKDGIASMFAKQEAKASPTKPKPKAKHESSKDETEKTESETGQKLEAEDGEEVKAEVHKPVVEHAESSTSAQKNAVRKEMKEEGLDKGIGDDSNAPNASRRRKRKAGKEMKVEEKDEDEVLVISDDDDDVKSKARPSPRKKRKT